MTTMRKPKELNSKTKKVRFSEEKKVVLSDGTWTPGKTTNTPTFYRFNARHQMLCEEGKLKEEISRVYHQKAIKQQKKGHNVLIFRDGTSTSLRFFQLESAQTKNGLPRVRVTKESVFSSPTTAYKTSKNDSGEINTSTNYQKKPIFFPVIKKSTSQPVQLPHRFSIVKNGS